MDGGLSEFRGWLADTDVVSWLLRVVEVMAVALVVAFLVKLLGMVYQAYLRNRLGRDLGLGLIPVSVRVRPRWSAEGSGAFHLVFPRWRYENCDRSADRRRRGNDLMRGMSTLKLGRYEFRAPDPALIYALVGQARRAGHVVGHWDAEVRKRADLARTEQARGALATARSIAQAFESSPTDFEEYCAEVFRSLGYRAQVTPPSRDGGYDLTLSYAGLTYIAECKCYQPTATIGRPLLQKLEGATRTVGAQGTFFITTARFSPDAREYARATGMELIDGARLVNLVRRLPAQPTAADHVELTHEEFRRFYPPDAR